MSKTAVAITYPTRQEQFITLLSAFVTEQYCAPALIWSKVNNEILNICMEESLLFFYVDSFFVCTLKKQKAMAPLLGTKVHKYYVDEGDCSLP